MSGELSQIIYTSAAVNALADKDLSAILAVARRNNARRDVTGMLAFHDSIFLQVLEGPQKAVDDLLMTIRLDPRHNGIVVLDRSPIDRRNFDQWSMGWLRADAAAEAGYDISVLRKRDTASPVLSAMLNAFRQVARLD